jgi:hypothetical protein
MLQRAVLAENAANEIATNWISLSTPLDNAGLEMQVDRLRRAQGRGEHAATGQGRSFANVSEVAGNSRIKIWGACKTR